MRWQFRSVPAGGLAHVAPRDISWYRVRESIVVLGGPLANVILLWIGLAGYANERSAGPGLMNELRPWTMLCLSNAAMLLYSLWPHTFETKYGRIPNDLLLLWRTWRRPKSDLEQTPVAL